MSAATANSRLQRIRRWTQAAFFALFLVAPALNLLRFDLHEAQLWVLGRPWSLGIAAFQRGEIDAAGVTLAILLRGVLPALLLIGGFLAVAWRYGRVYCGWLCPHFSLVEGLNKLLLRASGKLSLWDRTRQPGSAPHKAWWPVFVLTALGCGFLWAITLLTYLLPPREIWGGLVTGTLTANQARFIGIATLVFTAELTLARHLFCRFGCAVGFFQSLAWMANPRALVMAFERERAAECRDCEPGPDSCENACPMRLRPRTVKRLMFSCAQCGQCLDACSHSHDARGTPPSLTWHVDLEALRESLPSRRKS